MIYRFIMLSDEVDEFRRDLRLDADATFLDLHNTIIKSVGYKTGEMASFFICEDDWSKEAEITLVDMNTSTEEDSYIMADAVLSDFLEDERQKLMFVFDYLNDRAFFMELREIIFGEDLDKPEITKSVGNAPLQVLPIEEEPIVPKVVIPAPILDEVDETDEFYGDDSYNDDELDDDAFNNVDDEVSLDDLELEL